MLLCIFFGRFRACSLTGRTLAAGTQEPGQLIAYTFLISTLLQNI